MAAPKGKERREPVFDVAPAVEPDDDEAPAPRRSKPASSGGKSASRPKAKSKRKSSSNSSSAGSSGGWSVGALIGRTVYWGAVGSLWMVIAAIGVAIWIGAHLPPIQSLEIPKRPPTVKIVDASGQVLATRGNMGGGVVPLKDLPRHVPQAFIAIEDRRFYSHYGVDPIGIARALAANVLRRGVSQGGSTLTQQLAKNLFLTQERTLTRKVQEVGLALWLEHKFSKAQILDMYLNRVYFGAGAYGIEAAATRYFNKPAQKLTVAEAAMLAGLVRSPSRLAPSRNPNGAEKRAQLVLAAMVDMKFITDDAAKIALIQPAHAERPPGAGSLGYAADWIMDVLDDVVGRVDQDIVVEASIDPTLQAAAESALVEELNKNGAKAGVGQGALVAMTPDGAVIALVGGRNYAESQFNRAVAAKRQPGSAFKPFVYLTALERGLTPDTVREDKPVQIKGWRPENYTHEYFGPVTLTKALSMSLNTVSVRLTMEFGPTAVTRTAHRLGIASKLEPNASIALGTSEVSVLEMVGAYAPLANGGMAISPHVIKRVRTAGGKLLYERKPDRLGRIIEPRIVSMMNSMLQETLLSGTARKAELPGWPAAGKTGTSQEFRDAWFIGYTGHLVAGVWLGNDDSSPTRKTTGGGLPVEIWSRFMRSAHQGVPIAALPGTGGGIVTAGFQPPWNAQQPAPVSDAEAQVQPQRQAQAQVRPESGSGLGLDGWLIDRLMGRR